MSAHVEFYEDDEGGWRWRLKGANGEIVATGESHRDKTDAMRAFSTVRDLADMAFKAYAEGDD